MAHTLPLSRRVIGSVGFLSLTMGVAGPLEMDKGQHKSVDFTITTDCQPALDHFGFMLVPGVPVMPLAGELRSRAKARHAMDLASYLTA